MTTGGRPPRIDLDDIVRAGRELGLSRLSVKAVAARLGVTSTAIYRYVEGRWDLDRLVGESILAELELRDTPDHDVERHLLSFALQLREFALAHPGLAQYMQLLFPRGESGRRLLAAEVEALGRRGYAPDAAIILGSGAATVAIALAVSEENSLRAEREDTPGLERARHTAIEGLAGHSLLGAPHSTLPQMERSRYVRLLLTAVVRGLVEAAPPGRPADKVIAGLAAMGEGR
ncbi:TetR/AcrR family transcriptional regulator [Nonomuraea longicatena]|uniref:TetR family transcriptional regulator n=1 Tax=Nonomuraea longicatena TaxID=83682 RepID=A0ABP3ZCL3_9ACTN